MWNGDACKVSLSLPISPPSPFLLGCAGTFEPSENIWPITFWPSYFCDGPPVLRSFAPVFSSYLHLFPRAKERADSRLRATSPFPPSGGFEIQGVAGGGENNDRDSGKHGGKCLEIFIPPFVASFTPSLPTSNLRLLISLFPSPVLLLSFIQRKKAVGGVARPYSGLI